MRMSDGSSDVCSSDLVAREGDDVAGIGKQLARRDLGALVRPDQHGGEQAVDQAAPQRRLQAGFRRPDRMVLDDGGSDGHGRPRDWLETRSEEHTSELQSLMRNSYAVFCLKKKIVLHS